MTKTTNTEGMGGHFLCSGHLKNFNAVGELGQSVYQVASALREAIRRNNKKDEEALECFLAIPQENNTSHVVDWYADERLNTSDASNTSVINWNQATLEEQEVARQKLLSFEQRIKTLSLKLLEKSSEAKGDLYTFAKLLPKTIVTPSQLKEINQNNQTAYVIDPSYIYLVGAEQHPVLAFWGFSHPEAAANEAPFHFLHVPMVVATAPLVEAIPVPTAIPDENPAVVPVITPVVATNNWWSWLRWLLLLLLLCFLLFFVWRSCSRPALPTPGSLGTPSAITLPQPVLANGDRAPQKLWGMNLPKWLPSFGFGTGDGIGTGTGTGTGTGFNFGADTTTGTTAATETTGTTTTADNAAAPLSLPSADLPNLSSATPPNSPNTPSSNSLGPELAIPPSLANQTQAQSQAQTIPSYLNGNWQVHAIQDQKTGRPVRLEYSIKDGQGSVKIHQGNGVHCEGLVQAVGQSAGLSIDSTNQAICNDGSSYEMPQVECKLNARQETECFGRYGDQLFPISMRHATQ